MTSRPHAPTDPTSEQSSAVVGPGPQRDPSLSWYPLLGSAAIAGLLLTLIVVLNLTS